MPWRRSPCTVSLFSQKMVGVYLKINFLSTSVMTPKLRYTITAVLTFILSGLVTPSVGANRAIDPHWSGKHCTECHADERIPELKFNGDLLQVCIRCHNNGSPACVKAHEQEIILPDPMNISVPADWPFAESKITCTTCHAIRLQMHANSAEKRKNINFLRTDEPADITGFCFKCHEKALFQKINPHQQQIGYGAGNRPPCYFCHTEGLASGSEAEFEASLKTKSPALCTGCHGNLSKGHIVHVLLKPDTLGQKEAVFHEFEKSGIELPLENGRMHCATCHNPHPKGIIGRREAAVGAGEKYFLRTPDTSKLCVSCHADKKINKYMQLFQQKPDARKP